MSGKTSETRCKRPRLKGGYVKFEQTLFEPYADAVKGFEESIWNIYSQSEKAQTGFFGRIKFEVHWEPKETAEAYNAYKKGKDKNV